MDGNRCVVLGCSSSDKGEVGFHRIPWNKQELRRRCIENVVNVMGNSPAHVITCKSRVCKFAFYRTLIGKKLTVSLGIQ